MDLNAQYAPDGRHVAFMSDRTGDTEIWLSDRDGGGQAQLTAIGSDTGSPRWSPDSRVVVFDSQVSGTWNIFTIGVEGGSPKQITDDPSDAVVPAFA